VKVRLRDSRAVVREVAPKRMSAFRHIQPGMVAYSEPGRGIRLHELAGITDELRDGFRHGSRLTILISSSTDDLD
jgi:hypothetical protein